jgi:tungstate transport system substrate-binding protein
MIKTKLTNPEHLLHLTALALLMLRLAGCASPDPESVGPRSVLRLAVTTSTRDSGLLDVLIPVFESQHEARVDVIAVGTGAALKLGERGDVDVVLVHSRPAEDAFMANGHGVRREDVMYNTFEILGPPGDPGGVRELGPAQSLQVLSNTGQPFVSRGDESGTHQRELQLWKDGGGLSQWDGYLESGQGMGVTLIMADELNAYVLTDRATHLKFKDKIRLVPLVTSFETLKNPYGILTVDPEKHSSIDGQLAHAFVDFVISRSAQELIREYTVEDEQFFHPSHFPDEGRP